MDPVLERVSRDEPTPELWIVSHQIEGSGNYSRDLERVPLSERRNDRVE